MQDEIAQKINKLERLLERAKFRLNIHLREREKAAICSEVKEQKLSELLARFRGN